MKYLISFLIIPLLYSCSSDDGKEQFVYDVSVEFSVKDSEGNDLLNPENSNSFDESEIKLFYLINGEVNEVYDGNMDHPRNFVINEYPPASEYRIGVFLNYSETEEQPTTYIKWNETDTDTLKCEVYRTNSLTKITKLWLNDEQIWTSSDGTVPYFEILK
ncbi:MULTISPECIES: hypothetical protein [Arenibacter]|uniref:hypothetical protein n=1 Tax=Arenibacter TaxID=178469 RepID=UPI000A397804|nr:MULTISPECIES: hypothetical protein [Arenibacter]